MIDMVSLGEEEAHFWPKNENEWNINSPCSLLTVAISMKSGFSLSFVVAVCVCVCVCVCLHAC